MRLDRLAQKPEGDGRGPRVVSEGLLLLLLLIVIISMLVVTYDGYYYCYYIE